MKPFDFELPPDAASAGWEDRTVYAFVGPVCDSLEHRILVVLERKLPRALADLDTFAARRTENVIGGRDHFEIVKQTRTTLGTLPALELRLKQVLDARLAEQLQYFFLIDGDRGVTLSCRYTGKSFKLVGPEVREVIEHLVTRR